MTLFSKLSTCSLPGTSHELSIPIVHCLAQSCSQTCAHSVPCFLAHVLARPLLPPLLSPAFTHSRNFHPSLCRRFCQYLCCLLLLCPRASSGIPKAASQRIWGPSLNSGSSWHHQMFTLLCCLNTAGWVWSTLVTMSPGFLSVLLASQKWELGFLSILILSYCIQHTQ